MKNRKLLHHMLHPHEYRRVSDRGKTSETKGHLPHGKVEGMAIEVFRAKDQNDARSYITNQFENFPA